MVQSLVTFFSLASVVMYASCTLLQETTSNVASAASPLVLKSFLRAGAFVESPLVIAGADVDAATRALDLPLTSASVDPLAIMKLAETSYLYLATYSDSECKTFYSGRAEKLDICSPSANYYLTPNYHKYTVTSTQYLLSSYSDSSCKKLVYVETFPYNKDCTNGQKNFVSSSFLLPATTQHVALR